MQSNNETPAATPPDAAEVAAAASALAGHLHRHGVQFIPAADPESVQRYAQQFRGDDATSVVNEASSTGGSDSTPASALPSHAERTPHESDAATRSTALTPATASTPGTTGVQSTTGVQTTAGMFDESAGSYPGAALPVVQRQAKLDALAAEVSTCTKCPILSECRQHTVFGEGSADPRFVFFGEAPGADEDASGRPFVGAAGQLLDKIIAACQLKRDEVYIFNTIKCRPPGNRNPEPEELSNCREYFETQLSLLRPEYIVCLGAIAAQTLLDTKSPVGRMRQKLHRYRDSKVCVTYHPAYLLRNPKAKKSTWDDLRRMLADAGIEV